MTLGGLNIESLITVKTKRISLRVVVSPIDCINLDCCFSRRNENNDRLYNQPDVYCHAMTKQSYFFFFSFLLGTLPSLANLSADSSSLKYGISLGYKSFLVRDELESFRNFSGGSIPIGLSYQKQKAYSAFGINASFAWATLASANSSIEVKTFVSSLDLSYFINLSKSQWKRFSIEGGAHWINQASSRTYDFNSIVGGQDPFTGEIVSAPELALRFVKQMGSSTRLTAGMFWGPLAYLISRDYHPIRGFQSFAQVPKGFVSVGNFIDISSFVTYELALRETFEMAIGYKWRYLEYERSYPFQMGNQEITLSIIYNRSRR